MNFPVTRMRRLRRTEALRSLGARDAAASRRAGLSLFLCPGEGVRKEIGSMPGVFNLSVDEAVKEAEECAALGLGGLLLFGLPAEKRCLRHRSLRGARHRPAGAARAESLPRPATRCDDRRRLPVRVHVARPLRHRGE